MLGLVRDAKRSNMDPSGSPPCKSVKGTVSLRHVSAWEAQSLDDHPRGRRRNSTKCQGVWWLRTNLLSWNIQGELKNFIRE